MKNKKILMYSGIILLILFILVMGILVIKNHKKEEKQIIEEYTPQEEITDEQLRETNITLYFYDDSIKDIATEIRQIDSKQLLEKPEKQLIEFLIEGPTDENLTKLIPDNTKLLNTEIKKDILYIDFSEEFINGNLGMEQEKLIIDSILKTVSQLTEINGIKILINGQENQKFPDSELNFENIFNLDLEDVFGYSYTNYGRNSAVFLFSFADEDREVFSPYIAVFLNKDGDEEYYQLTKAEDGTYILKKYSYPYTKLKEETVEEGLSNDKLMFLEKINEIVKNSGTFN